MKLVPYEQLTIRTSLSPEDAIKRIRENVEPERHFRGWGPSEKPYQGDVLPSAFLITRIIQYSNSFLPIIRGYIQPDVNGSVIRIMMRPRVRVLLFMVFWLSLAGLGFLFTLGLFVNPSLQAINLNKEPSSPILILIPAGLLVYGYLLFYGGFKVESVKSKKFFYELLQANQVEELELVDLIK